jgi:hypothetical protein
MLEERHQAYVLAVRANHHVRFGNEDGLIATDPAALSDALSPADWAAHAAGEGTNGSMTGQGSGCPGSAMRDGSAGS